MLTPNTKTIPTPPTLDPDPQDVEIMQHAIQAAQKSFSEGGIPIGAALYYNPPPSLSDSNNSLVPKLLGTGHNQRVQLASATRHGEIDCFESIGRLPPSVLNHCVLYSTLSPCTMCSGAAVLFGVRKVVIGENETFVGGEDVLKGFGVEVVNLDLQACKDLMAKFIEEKPEIWWEDIGEVVNTPEEAQEGSS
ncbi:cytidine deaminase-like protein [Clavulina sp. PMI_390]|nr:cytidine deaminase-like protein [Clavulina sp. PMI_390]